MNGIHDMGGMHGFGPIDFETDEPVFHHEWEGRVYAIRGPLAGSVRATIERMPPTHVPDDHLLRKVAVGQDSEPVGNGRFYPGGTGCRGLPITAPIHKPNAATAR